MGDIRSIRNLGPAMETAFHAAGLTSAEALRDLGADAAYARLLAAGSRPHFMAYLALVLGLQGRPLSDCGKPEKAELRTRFDAIVSTAQPDGTGIEAILDEIGIRPGNPERKAPPAARSRPSRPT